MKKVLLIIFLFILSPGILLFGRKLSVLTEIAKPSEIIIDNNLLLISDLTNQLHLYSMTDFKYQKQLFKRGEGPGEAYGVAYVWTSPEYIYLYCMGKNSFFTRDGNFVKEFRTPIAKIKFIQPVGNKFLCQKYESNKITKGTSNDISLCTYTPNKEMKFDKLLYYYEVLPITWKGNRRPFTIIKQVREVLVFGNRIFICDSERGLFFQVYDFDGNRLDQIKLDTEKIKVPEDYSADFFKNLKETGKLDSFNSQFYYDQPEYFPGFYRFYVGKNKIYFLTYKRIGDTREVITCDWHGNSVKKAYIPWMSYGDLRNCTVWDDKFYYLVDNQETEEWELHVADIK